MNKLTLLLALILLIVLNDSLLAQNSVKQPKLSQKIDYLMTKYQEQHNRKSEILREHGWNSKQMKDNEVLVEQAFQLNYEAAKKIVKEYGFPSYSMVGEESSHRFWEMIQHFDHDVELQMQVVRLMKRAVDRDDASAIDFAYLSDRTLLNLGREQNYGTQIKYDTRQAMNDYISEMNEKYDGAVVQKPRVKRYHDSVGRPKEVIERLRNN